jgi:hypothetical protein
MPKRKPDLDPEEIASEQRMKQHLAHLERLKAHQVQVQQKVHALKAKVFGNSERDWLLYLPSAAGSPELINRACSYLEQMRTRLEAEGTKAWLCVDHDCQTRAFLIDEFRVFDGAVFCSGGWVNKEYRAMYKGVSADNISFAGDLDILSSMWTPLTA